MKVEMKDALGLLVAATAVLAGLLQYRRTSYDEFIKPVRETQLRLYQEASAAAAGIATLPKDSAEREKSRRDFLRLYYGPLTMIGDFDHGPHEDENRIKVEDAMEVFRLCLETEDCKDDTNALHKLSLALAWTCRESLRKSWRYQAEQGHLEQENIIRDYLKRFRKAARQSVTPAVPSPHHS